MVELQPSKLAIRVRFPLPAHLMNFRVYILYSNALDRFYAGFTARGSQRIKEHRRKHQGWTGQANDWLEVFSTPVETRAEAREFEKQIKARGAKRFLAGRKQTEG
jgi:putative endonuclease